MDEKLTCQCELEPDEGCPNTVFWKVTDQRQPQAEPVHSCSQCLGAVCTVLSAAADGLFTVEEVV